jgi:hypothetical protein
METLERFAHHNDIYTPSVTAKNATMTEKRPTPRTVTLNARAVNCMKCGRWIEVENGEIIGKEPSTNRWLIQHLPGLCERAKKRVFRTPDGDVPFEQQNHHDSDDDRDYDPKAPKVTKRVEYLPEKEFQGIAEGFYCVKMEGPHSVKCRLECTASGRKRFVFAAPGAKRILWKDMSLSVLKGIRADGALQCSKLYAAATGNCYKCNRQLTDAKSIELGIGAVCRGEESPTHEKGGDGELSEAEEEEEEEESSSADDFVVVDHVSESDGDE